MKNKSFTLIELLVVIVIIGILAGVIMISTSSSINKASIAKLKVFEESVANDLAANMVSRWKLDDIIETNKTSDAWGNIAGVLVNNPVWATENECISGRCMEFNGLNSINFGNDDVLNFFKHSNKNFTISIWLKRSNFDNSQVIFSKGKTGEGYSFSLRDSFIDDGFYFTALGVKDYNASQSYQRDGAWHLIIIEYDQSYDVSFYVDGLFREKIEHSIAGIASSENFILGGSYKGLIDDVKVYNAALSSSHVKQNYIAGLNSMLSNGSISKEEYNERISTLAYE